MHQYTDNLNHPKENVDHIVKYYQAKINSLISRIEILELETLKLETENRELMKEIESLEKENDKLSLEIDAIESNNFQQIRRRYRED